MVTVTENAGGGDTTPWLGEGTERGKSRQDSETYFCHGRNYVYHGKTDGRLSTVISSLRDRSTAVAVTPIKAAAAADI